MSKNTNKSDTVTGTVVEAMPNTMFLVEREDNDEQVIMYLSGKMRKYRIRVVIGDKVKAELDPYGGKARIVQRF